MKRWTREDERKISNEVAWKGGCWINGVSISPGHPKFYVKDHKDHGKALRCDYPSLEGEDAEAYWYRVRNLITEKYLKERKNNMNEQVQETAPVVIETDAVVFVQPLAPVQPAPEADKQ